MDVLELRIFPEKTVEAAGLRVRCNVLLGSGDVGADWCGAWVKCRIKEGKKGVYVAWTPAAYPANAETRRTLGNRILATYIVNHCRDQ
jgi:hypothetical protein